MQIQNIKMKTISAFAILTFLTLTAIPTIGFSQADVCKVTRNFYTGDGGTSESNDIKGSNGCKTIVMKTGFETITLKLGSLPATTADFTIVNYTATPGQNEISIKNYSDSGNEVETLDFDDDGKTAFVCNDNGRITITWKDVRFKHTANGGLYIKTTCEMTCDGAPKTNNNSNTQTTTTTSNGGNTVTTTSNSSSSSSTTVTGSSLPTNNTATPTAVDPDAQLKTEIANYETQLGEHTKSITAKEYELNEKKSKKQIDSIDAVIANYDIDILKQKRDETKYALERSTKTLNKTISVDAKQDYIAKEEQCKLKAKSLEASRNSLAETKTLNTASKKAKEDLTALIAKLDAEVKASVPQNTMDSLNLKVKQIELERSKSELEKNKLIEERTTKSLKGRLTDKAAQEYTSKENDYQQKINDCNNRIGEQQKLIKAESKKNKKENNKAKVDSVKVKLKLKLLEKNITSKEKDVEKYKKKNNAEKLAKAEKELADMKKEQADLQKELAGYDAQLKK